MADYAQDVRDTANPPATFSINDLPKLTSQGLSPLISLQDTEVRSQKSRKSESRWHRRRAIG